jgi:hypothetical protein
VTGVASEGLHMLFKAGTYFYWVHLTATGTQETSVASQECAPRLTIVPAGQASHQLVQRRAVVRPAAASA